MAPHETGDDGEDAIVSTLDALHATPNSGPALAPASTSAAESNVKRRVRHTRQASVDNYQEPRNEFQYQHQYPAQKKKSVTISQKQFPEDRRPPDTIDSRLSPSSALSPGEAVPVPPVAEANSPKDEAHPYPHDEIGVPHSKERPRRAGPRRKSPRRLLSPHPPFSPQQQPHAMDFIVGEAEEPPYFAPAPMGVSQGGPTHHNRLQSPMHMPHVDEMGLEIFDGHYLPPQPAGPNHPSFNNRFSSPEIPFHHEGGGFFSRPPGHSPFPGDVPILPALPALPPPEGQLSGYQLIAANLSGDVAGPRLAPIYRRFETLHHRLLLNLQDELTHLEARLDELDAQDAQHRMYGGNGRPGSRRAERSNSQDMNWTRNEVLGQIAQKLYQYHQALASFKETQDLGEPTRAEVFGYRHYIQDFVPEVMEEGKFLDASDLVSLSRRKSIPTEVMMDDHTGPPLRPMGIATFPPSSPPSEVGSHRSSARRSHVRTTPAPQAGSLAPMPSRPKSHSQSRSQGHSQLPSHSQSQSQTPLVHLVLVLTAVILVPILSFSVIRGFVGRMMVVLLISLGGAAAAFQSGHLMDRLFQRRNSMDLAVCVGAYGAAMAMIAGTVS